jgi:hypothetical protein
MRFWDQCTVHCKCTITELPGQCGHARIMGIRFANARIILGFCPLECLTETLTIDCTKKIT